MKKYTNKQYLIDLTIKSFQAKHQFNAAKVRCQIHFKDDNYLKLNIAPLLKHGIAHFCDERIRVPFSSEVDIIFKMLKADRKEQFMGHYTIQIVKMLAQKCYGWKAKEKLEESDCWVEFQCRILDKQLIYESENEEIEDEVASPTILKEKSVGTWLKNKKNPFLSRSLSEYNKPFRIGKSPILKQEDESILSPQQFGKIVRQVDDILQKKQVYAQKRKILQKYSRNRQGGLKSKKMTQLQSNLSECKRQKDLNHLLFYAVIGIIGLLAGFNL